RQADRALALLQDRVVADFLRDPVLPAPLDLDMVDPSLLADAPDRLLSLALDLLMSGQVARGGEYLDLLERAQPSVPPGTRLTARLAGARSAHFILTGRAGGAGRTALAARAIQERTTLSDDWIPAIAVNLRRAYTWLEDYEAVDREAAAALATPELTEPVKLVLADGVRALARYEAGRLPQAAEAAEAAE